MRLWMILVILAMLPGEAASITKCDTPCSSCHIDKPAEECKPE